MRQNCVAAGRFAGNRHTARIAAKFREYASALNCSGGADGGGGDGGTSQQRVDCLRSKHWIELIYAIKGRDVTTGQQRSTWVGYAYHWISQKVIDGEFFIEQPSAVWRRGAFNRAIELVVGFTSDEAVQFYPLAHTDALCADVVSTLATQFDDDNTWVIKDDDDDDDDDEDDDASGGGGRAIKRRNGQALRNEDELRARMKARYYSDDVSTAQRMRGCLNMSRDYMFMSYSVWCAQQVARHDDVSGSARVYMFAHKTQSLDLTLPAGLTVGAPHGAELPYQFGYAFTDPGEVRMTSAERNLSLSVIHAWTSFAAAT